MSQCEHCGTSEATGWYDHEGRWHVCAFCMARLKRSSSEREALVKGVQVRDLRVPNVVAPNVDVEVFESDGTWRIKVKFDDRTYTEFTTVGAGVARSLHDLVASHRSEPTVDRGRVRLNRGGG